jgi:hypothetical protein
LHGLAGTHIRGLRGNGERNGRLVRTGAAAS